MSSKLYFIADDGTNLIRCLKKKGGLPVKLLWRGDDWTEAREAQLRAKDMYKSRRRWRRQRLSLLNLSSRVAPLFRTYYKRILEKHEEAFPQWKG